MRTKSVKSGLVFPVARILRYMKHRSSFRSKRVETKASVYLSAVMEYLTSELAELAGDFAKKEKRRLLTPRHIMLAFMNDEELQKSFGSVMFPFSGVVPGVHCALIAPKSPRRSSSVHNARIGARLPKSGKPPRKTPPITVLSERIIGKNTKLSVIRGSVTTTAGSVVIHPTDASMNFHGQVGTALLNAGGPQLTAIVQNELQANGRMEPGGVRLTKAAGLPVDYILHCESPAYHANNVEVSVKNLSDLIQKCLRLCDDHNLPLVNLPSVGSGNCHYPKQLAAETILGAIKAYCDANRATTILQAVRFVLFDQESIAVYSSEMARLQ